MLLSSTRLCVISSVSLVQAYLEGRVMTARDLAAKHKFNPRSINPSLTRLVKAGILHSQVGGNSRGFVLAKDPKQITLFDIVYSLEGDRLMVPCSDMMNGIVCSIGSCENCQLYNKLNKLQAYSATVIRSITLYDHYLSSLADYKAVETNDEIDQDLCCDLNLK